MVSDFSMGGIGELPVAVAKRDVLRGGGDQDQFGFIGHNSSPDL
jgi:hypothetical protein